MIVHGCTVVVSLAIVRSLLLQLLLSVTTSTALEVLW